MALGHNVEKQLYRVSIRISVQNFNSSFNIACKDKLYTYMYISMYTYNIIKQYYMILFTK